MNSQKKQLIFSYYLAALSLIGMAFVFIVTFRYGPGLSTDGARYLSTAENLIDGKGFYDYSGTPLTQFPPLYPILIAGIGFITGADVMVIGQYLNILTFGLTIWLAGIFFRKIFPEDYAYAYVGSTVFASSVAVIQMASNILSDLLFMVLTIVFLLAASAFIKTNSKKNILILGLIASISPLERFAGLTFIITGTIIIFMSYQKEFSKGVFLSGVFGFLSSIPVISWVVFHNYLQTGILFGRRYPPSVWGNIETTIDKAMHWFVPYSVTNIVPNWVFLVIPLIILLTGNRLVDWNRWRDRLTSPQFLPGSIFLVLYLGVLIFNVSYTEVRYSFMDRIHIIILPALMALGFLTFKELKPIYLRQFDPGKLRIAALALFMVWLFYPLNNVQKFVISSYQNGDTSVYNIYNTHRIRESGLEEYLKSLSIDPSTKIYSNYEPVAWLFTRQQILSLPRGSARDADPDPETVLQNFPGWPGRDGKGYLIWMKNIDFKTHILTPKQLSSKADFQLLFSSREGDIYLLTPK